MLHADGTPQPSTVPHAHDADAEHGSGRDHWSRSDDVWRGVRLESALRSLAAVAHAPVPHMTATSLTAPITHPFYMTHLGVRLVSVLSGLLHRLVDAYTKNLTTSAVIRRVCAQWAFVWRYHVAPASLSLALLAQLQECAATMTPTTATGVGALTIAFARVCMLPRRHFSVQLGALMCNAVDDDGSDEAGDRIDALDDSEAARAALLPMTVDELTAACARVARVITVDASFVRTTEHQASNSARLLQLFEQCDTESKSAMAALSVELLARNGR
jgi:hypothetical protein